jgi:glycosyltransferase involved in cell wall biosynthesis
MRPSISFFIPAYRCEATITETIESILHTNFLPGDEIVITEDGSPDGTLALIKTLAQQHPEIKLIQHPYNKGGGAARNTCVQNAQHSLLFCLDADNLLLPNSILPLQQQMEKTKADIAAFQELRFFSKPSHEVDFIWKVPEETRLVDFLGDHRNSGSSGNYLFTKESWKRAGGYPEFAGALDAWGFGLRQMMAGCKMVALPDSGYLHRHGIESYYVRDMKSSNMSLKALQLLIPYLDRIHPEDVEYIMGPEGRNQWYEKSAEHPIRLKGENETRRLAAEIHHTPSQKMGLICRILRKLQSWFCN